ncbi:MAG: thioredoxin family protein [Opitutaceae bacterium]|jgi:thiol:disulfide interchange protein DsbD|nr:thioredoxin family protein [Opitutaceae bacterium]
MTARLSRLLPTSGRHSPRSALALSLLLAVFALALPAAARAQVKASFVALDSGFPADARELTVGLRLVHQPHWHTYWLQPGTGLPTSLDWQLPPGWTAGPIRWPAPHRVYDTAGNLAGNGYEGTTYLPVTLTPPPDLAPGVPVTLRARADWLMCKEVCVPGAADLSLTLTPTAPGATKSAVVADSPEGEALLATINALPAALPTDLQATAARTPGDKILRLSLSGLPGLAKDPWFFASDAAIAYDQPQSQTASASGLVLELPVSEDAYPAVTRLRGVLTFANGPAYELDLPITAAPAAAAVESAKSATTASFAGILAIAFVGGLILNLMPCVFPVLGLKVMSFVQQAGEDRKKITAHGLVFTSGVLLSFWLLAATLAILRAGGASLGWGFQLQEPAFVFALAAVVLAFALNMSGVFEFALRATSLGGGLQQKPGLAGSFFTGVLATIVATPCSAPFLAPALGAALALPTVQSFAVFTAIGLGLSTPYLLLAAWPAAIRALPRPGAWMESFKHGMAFLLYATVALMVWILAGQLSAEALLSALLALSALAFALWLYGLATAPNKTGRARPVPLVLAALVAAASLAYGWPRAASPDALVWEPWSAERVAALRAEGRPIYVDFTARWCFTCQTNKKTVFSGPGSGEVLKAFRDNHVATLRGDWTNRDPLITAELARHHRAAVPFNLVYLPGQADPAVLPELLSPAIVVGAIKR